MMQQAHSKRGRSSRRQWVVALSLVALLLMVIVSRRQVEMGSMLAPVNNNPVPLEDVSEENKSDDETTTNKPIRQISILGERNSGTRWTFAYV